MSTYQYRPRVVEAVQFVDGKPGRLRGWPELRQIRDGNRVIQFEVRLEHQAPRRIARRHSWETDRIYPGDWAVLENGLVSVYPDYEFRATFESATAGKE